MTPEQFESVRLYLVIAILLFRLTMMPKYLQSYLNMAYHKIEEIKSEAGKISNVELQKLIVRVFYYLCVVSWLMIEANFVTLLINYYSNDWLGNPSIYCSNGTHFLSDLDVQNYGGRELVWFLDPSGISKCHSFKPIFFVWHRGQFRPLWYAWPGRNCCSYKGKIFSCLAIAKTRKNLKKFFFIGSGRQLFMLSLPTRSSPLLSSEVYLVSPRGGVASLGFPQLQ